MASENQDVVSTFAAVVEGKIKALQALLDSLRSAIAMGAFGSGEGLDLSVAASSPNGVDMTPIDLPEGAFNGKTLPACVKLYLSAAKRKKSIKEIAAALREGGVESTSDNFDNVVTGAMFRLKSNGEVLRFKDGWGLSEWYPANMRGSAPAGSAKRARKKGKKNERKNAVAKLPSGQSGSTKVKASERIIELLRTKPEREYSLVEIAKHLWVSVSVASMILGQLRKSGKIKMSAPGMYAIGKPQLVATGD